MKRWGPALHIALVTGLAGLIAYLLTRPPPPLAPLPAAHNLRPPPAQRRWHDLDLTVVSMKDRKPVASTSAEVAPRPAPPGARLVLVATMEGERRYYVRVFLVDSQGGVVGVTPTAGKEFIWKKPADQESYPIVSLPAVKTPGDLLVRAFLAFAPFTLPRAAVAQAQRRGGRSPLDPRPLPISPPRGRARPTFTQLAVRVLRKR